jgi:hypothetical protein
MVKTILAVVLDMKASLLRIARFFPRCLSEANFSFDAGDKDTASHRPVALCH